MEGYSHREQTRLLTMVLADIPGFDVLERDLGKQGSLELTERYRQTVRGVLTEFSRIEEIACSGTLFLIAGGAAV